MLTVTGLVALLATFAVALTPNQCNLTVLYESHCSDSRKFIRNVLAPVWPLLETHCTLELVPFGKARSNESGFVCHHGEKECKSNMVMSCAMRNLLSSRQQMDFVSCYMGDPDYGGIQCAEKTGLSWADVKACMQSGEGTQLQKEAEAKSYATRISHYVPTVVINKVYKPTEQNEAVRGKFNEVMCRYTRSSDICSLA
ncbi:gamma-interferon-inducible lysosomal thiol reductase-like [Homalodisca vitripennis]|uniref:gamma-interferon-inducible lysosomal thiol reductase-like n=1 Tax=Homalodisca vitripennis TaxID=197043 RepID=UPI001EEC49D7|nr:gamma-interferon-inducible lysosomal thiol reductase-like [Homalodisca vitripennis]